MGNPVTHKLWIGDGSFACGAKGDLEHSPNWSLTTCPLCLEKKPKEKNART
jgi:hypothetical protein